MRAGIESWRGKWRDSARRWKRGKEQRGGKRSKEEGGDRSEREAVIAISNRGRDKIVIDFI